jgi:hypothetical protein
VVRDPAPPDRGLWLYGARLRKDCARTGEYASILHALGVPVTDLLAWATILVELFGGLAVFLGAFIPLASIPMAIVLLVAIFTVRVPNGFSSIKLLSVDAAGRISVSPAMRRLCSTWLRSLPWSLAVPGRWPWTDFCCIREDAMMQYTRVPMCQRNRHPKGPRAEPPSQKLFVEHACEVVKSFAKRKW